MIEGNYTYSINNRPFSYKYTCENTNKLQNTCLFVDDENLLDQSDFIEEGFKVTQFLDKKLFNSLKNKISDFIKSRVEGVTGKVIKDFTLENYHNYVNDIEHLNVLSVLRTNKNINGFSLPFLPFSSKEIEKCISSALNNDVTLDFVKMFWIRIVRPGKNDFNAVHKDSHVLRCRHAVNLYVPIAGSTDMSSLPVLPRSHLMAEPLFEFSGRNLLVNGIKYTNPAIVRSSFKVNMTTPNPREGEVLIFTPYALHGGAANENKNQTRVSLEIRMTSRNFGEKLKLMQSVPFEDGGLGFSESTFIK